MNLLKTLMRPVVPAVIVTAALFLASLISWLIVFFAADITPAWGPGLVWMAFLVFHFSILPLFLLETMGMASVDTLPGQFLLEFFYGYILVTVFLLLSNRRRRK